MLDGTPAIIMRSLVALWAVVLVVAISVVNIAEVHVHAASEAALYDEDCPLMKLAAGPGKALLLGVPEARQLALAGNRSPVTDHPSPPTFSWSSYDPRAPPTAA